MNVSTDRPCFWLTSHELGQEQIYQFLKEAQPIGDTHVGVGGMQNLNMVAIRDSVQHIALFDSSQKVARFWRGFMEIILTAKTRHEFGEQFVDWMLDRSASNRPLSDRYLKLMKALHVDETLQVSWLATDERYDKIRNIFLQGHFSFTQLQISEIDQIHTKLWKPLQQAGRSIDTCYLSNIFHGLSEEIVQRHQELLPHGAIVLSSQLDTKTSRFILALSTCPGRRDHI